MKQFLNGKVTLFGGDSREVIKECPDNTIDAILTDPPYALVSIVKRFGKEGAAPAKGNEAFMRASRGFMGKQWDTGEVVNDPAFWAECLRVLKPGGHLLSFGGTRTYHRMACAVEDAGFEVRDMIQWLYGSGFPKSHDVSKGINAKERYGNSHSSSMRKARMGDAYEPTGQKDWKKGAHFATPGGYAAQNSETKLTENAAEWEGWGTALKPANEPIVLARKPLSEKTVAANVLKWGTGAINIDGCRVEVSEEGEDPRLLGKGNWSTSSTGKNVYEGGYAGTRVTSSPLGRFPANVIHDGSEEVLKAFPISKDGVAISRNKQNGKSSGNQVYGQRNVDLKDVSYGSHGSAARFFYQAKANKKDRAGSKHPTVKPIKLLRYLARLITPPGGIILDPFAGSGTTGEAAYMEGFHAVLIEREKEYHDDIEQRLRSLDNVFDRTSDEDSEANAEVQQ